MLNLQDRILRFEDNYAERKSDQPKAEGVRETVVAFANSLPEDRTAVLYIGVQNDGTIQGVVGHDSLEKTVKNYIERCYPKINCRYELLPQKDGKVVLAVEVLYGKNRPYFTGPAFIREGSANKKASDQIFEESIASRQEKPSLVLPA